VRHDPNAAVRLKALEALRPFRAEAVTRGTLEFVLEHDSNPDVRSEAIDVLAPPDGGVQWSPDLAGTLQQVMRSQPSDEYVRMRCMQLLDSMRASLGVY
jgi:HEAT repeat protein